MTTTRVGDIHEAIEVADTLRGSGRRYWFRGQRRDWPVRSTFIRLAEDRRHAAMQKLARYEEWVKSTRGLEALADSPDNMIAVAQHYGLPTNFIDFTDEPRVAAFFASENDAGSVGREMACLICLDVDDLLEFWIWYGRDNPPPEPLELAVPDLWRLEAQRGKFLFCPYDNFERIYNFDRIYFPATSERVVTPEEIYPKRKSHLEILLDQYFMNQHLIETEDMVKAFPGAHLYFEAPPENYDSEVFPHGVPPHPSWAGDEFTEWLELRPEPLNEVRTDASIQIDVRASDDATTVYASVAEQVMSVLVADRTVRRKLVSFRFASVLDGIVAPAIIAKLTTLWDGMRRLPYSDTNIARAIGMCVALGLALKGQLRNPDMRYWEEAAESCMPGAIQIELSAADGSYSRGFASASRIAAAVRPDIVQFASDQWREHVAKYPTAVLQTAWDPRSSFTFDGLVQLFATDLIPYQVLARDGAIFYSPARIKTIGLP